MYKKILFLLIFISYTSLSASLFGDDEEVVVIPTHTIEIHGEKYFYCYTLKFHAECQEIAFGMSIKTEKGFQITTTGSKHYDTVINQTSIGDTYTIQWEFICLLTAGVYYANAGTTHQVKNKRQILNRVIDSLAFKVLPLSTKIHGVVSLQQSPSYHLIHKE